MTRTPSMPTDLTSEGEYGTDGVPESYLDKYLIESIVIRRSWSLEFGYIIPP
jgi:hypothetical protein